MSSWTQIGDGVFLLRDSCNVYAVRGRDGAWLIVNAGTGRAAPLLRELGEVREATVLLTHFFRDHTAGAEAFRRAGARVFAPYLERDHLSEPQTAFRGPDHWLLYELSWDNFAPIEPIRVERWLRDYERATLAGLPVEVIPSPGATLGAASYGVELPGGGRAAFVGELMCGPGRVPRLSPLQYDYGGIPGAENVLLSWERVLAWNPSVAYPSLGEPLRDPAPAVALLRKNLEAFDALQPGFAARLAESSADDIEEVLPRLYRATRSMAETHFIAGRSGRVLAIDYGYAMAPMRYPRRVRFSTHRTLLHSLAAIRRRLGADRIDTVIATHYHDDHVGSVGTLQRVFGTELWAGENFADLIEHPADYDRPCLWPEPIRVHRRLPLGRTIQWEDVAITLHPMVGHTEFSTLLCLEIDGRRVAHTGDQFFFVNAKGDNVPPQAAAGIYSNHEYRNGLALGGYGDCLRHLRAFAPEVVLSGHFKPYRPDEAAWRMLERTAQAFDDVHRALMPLGDADVHFGPESQPAKLQPYNLLIPEGGGATPLRGWVMNPFPAPARAELAIVTPPGGWRADPVQLALEPRRKHPFETTLVVPPGTRCRRQPIALELVINGRPFGQVAEAWVTAGYDRF